jgi:hypothetical protein
MAESHLLDALRCRTDLTFASQILPPRKGILRLRRGHVAMIIGASGLNRREVNFLHMHDGLHRPGAAACIGVMKILS